MTHHVAILLCAGYGIRMGPLTAQTPKPLLPVAGKPVLDYLLEQLRELSGLGTIHIVSNALHVEAFRTWAEAWRRRLPSGLALEVHDDGSRGNDERLGAIGDLDFLLRRLGGLADGALVSSGDNIYRFSLDPFWRAFLDGGGSRVMALKEPEAFRLRHTGVLELGDEGRVLALWEKPRVPPSHWACPSIYCFTAAALARVGPYLAAGRARDETGRFVAYLVDREPVFAVETAGERLHVGSPEDYRRADEILRQNAGSATKCNKPAPPAFLMLKAAHIESCTWKEDELC